MGCVDQRGTLGSLAVAALLRWRRRLADNELGRQLYQSRRVRRPRDLGQQHLGADPSGVEQLLPYGRQADIFGRLDVVVPDDREVVGDTEAEVVRPGNHAERLGVAGGEDRRRPLATVQDSPSEVTSL